jgi:hypothetical protein
LQFLKLFLRNSTFECQYYFRFYDKRTIKYEDLILSPNGTFGFFWNRLVEQTGIAIIVFLIKESENLHVERRILNLTYQSFKNEYKGKDLDTKNYGLDGRNHESKKFYLKVSIFMQFLDGIIASSIASLRLMFALNI